MAKADKATAVADIAEQFKGSTATVVTEYRGLTVANLAEPAPVARRLGHLLGRQEHAGQACRAEAGIEGLDELFVGPTAIAFIKGEPVDAAKALQDLRQGQQGAGHQGRLHGRPPAERRRGRADR